MHDDEDVKHGGHTPADRLTQKMQAHFTAYIFDTGHPCHVNKHLSKKGIHWPVSRDHIVGSSLELI